MEMKLFMNDEEKEELYEIVTNAIRESYLDDVRGGFIKVIDDELPPIEEWEFGDAYFDQIDVAIQQICRVFNVADPYDI